MDFHQENNVEHRCGAQVLIYFEEKLHFNCLFITFIRKTFLTMVTQHHGMIASEATEFCNRVDNETLMDKISLTSTQMDVNLYLEFFKNAFLIASYRANNATFVSLISLLSLTFSMAFLSWSHYGDQSVCLKKI